MISSMEDCLASLRMEVNEKASSAIPMNTMDCLQWLNRYQISSHTLSETADSDILHFLRTLQSFMKNHPNREEVVLQLLWDLSCQCGVTFASSPSGSAFHCVSQTSLHAVDDNSCMEIHTTWDEIRLLLRRYLFSRVQDNMESCPFDFKVRLKTQCFHHLLFIYPEQDILLKYQNTHQNHIMELLHGNSPRGIETTLQLYQDVIPKVYSMIKEDLFVLSRVIDPSLLIKFINETFFELVTEEMKSFFQILCEGNKEDHRLPPKQTKRKYKQRVHALVPGAGDQAGKTMTKNVIFGNLKYLARFVKLFLWLEENVEALSSEILFLTGSTEIKETLHGISKNDFGESKSMESHVLDENSPVMKEMPTLKFGWRNTLKALSDSLLHHLPADLEDFSIQILQRENEEYSSTSGNLISLVSVHKSYEFYGAVSDEQKPRKIAKFCFDITEEFDALFPLALACKGDTMKEIRTCLVEGLREAVTRILARLEDRIVDVPSKAPLQNMLVALSTAAHVLHHVTFYSDRLSDKSLFPAAVQKYQEFISNLQIQITNYCVNVCATSILQDAESHHWDDNKAFYEGERCSFSIQMWHYFCCGLRHDLWTMLPPEMAQRTLGEVVEQTLALLTFRYSQVHPNYKRASQIRIDVIAILSCVENLLWSLCSSVHELVKPAEHAKNIVFKIHNHCNSLLSILAIVTAPLPTLHEICKNTFTVQDSDPSETAPEDLLFWLVYLKPKLFSPLFRTPSAGEMAVQGQLKLLLSQPCCNWNLLLETLLHPDCLIARTLLTNSISENLESNDDDLLQLSNQYNKDLHLAEVILMVFSSCTLTPTSFTALLEKHMDQENLWDSLCGQPAQDSKTSLPQVIKYLHKTLLRSVAGTMKQVTSLILSNEPVDHSDTYHHTLFKAIPQKWNFTPRESLPKMTQKSITKLTAEAVSIVISKLPSIIACLPPPIKYFYAFAEGKISEQNSVVKEKGLLLGNLICAICQILKDGNTIEHMSSSTLSTWSKERLAEICVSLESAFGRNLNDPKEMAQRVLKIIEKQRPTWIEQQLLKAKNLSMECFSALREDGSVLKDQGSRFELTEQKINTMVLNMCHKPGGSEYLRQIYHIIQLNEESLNELLSVQDSDRLSEQSRAFQMTWTSREEMRQPFNPMHMFSLPNPELLIQTASTEWDWNWSVLLSDCLKANRVTFHALLGHRYLISLP
uniref:KIAA0825 n=1 Tax=Leptobrachium leishanense TaxID=445787 RepID=A0A8C5M0A3_9ANUR